MGQRAVRRAAVRGHATGRVGQLTGRMGDMRTSEPGIDDGSAPAATYGATVSIERWLVVPKRADAPRTSPARWGNALERIFLSIFQRVEAMRARCVRLSSVFGVSGFRVSLIWLKADGSEISSSW
jgi:hypothetical protein